MAQTEQQTKNSKAATYLALSGALGFVSTVFIAPFSWPVIAVAATVGVLATNEKGRDFLKKTGDQLMQLGRDVAANVTEDVGRAQSWWERFKAKRAEKAAATTAAPPAPEQPSTFKNGSSKNEFGNAAKPDAEVAVKAEPAVEQEAKKPAPKAKAEPAPKH
ncbi:MAG: hypothetical protein GC185_00640 [Alphaproteobacteria bacterium]|nr:hypothetical protein [Alphaproteobacteria bacterium]